MPYIPGRKKQKKREEAEPREPHRPGPTFRDRPADLDVLKIKSAYAELEAAHRQIRESTIEMILNLAIAAEYKDPDTGNHILRISDYSTEIARSLGLPADEIEILRYASPMHDIGKIGIPDNILQKPGKLTPEEWEVMKTHTLIGARIVGHGKSKSMLLNAAAEIALCHHEHYDGSGYPQGLRGDKIPLFARIVALADVFDATASERCYKKKWPVEEALKYIRSMAGTHLDPHLVRVFATIEDKIQRIYKANTSIEEFIREGDT